MMSPWEGRRLCRPIRRTHERRVLHLERRQAFDARHKAGHDRLAWSIPASATTISILLKIEPA